MPYVETVNSYTKKSGGKEYPVTVTRRTGTHLFKPPNCEEEVLVDAVTFMDYGPKLGTTTVYTVHQDYTEEERAAGREHVREVARKIMEARMWK